MNVKKYLFITFMVFTFAFVSLSGPSLTHAKPIELSYSLMFPPLHAHAKLAEAWIQEVEKRSGGSVKIAYYPGGALLKADKMFNGVVSGITDIGMSVFVYTRGMFPSMEIGDLPLGFSDGAMGTLVMNDYYKKVRPEKLDKAVKVFYVHSCGPCILHTTKKPVYKLEDLKGLKIRGQAATAKIIEALGGVPVAMPQAEAYEALQKGVAEGNLTPMEVLKSWRQAEVVKYTTECYSIANSSTFYVVMNKEKWNSLPEDIKKIIDDVNAEWIGKHAKAWAEIDDVGREYTLSLGNKVIPLSEDEGARWRKAAEPVIDDFVEDLESKGLPGKLYLQTVKEIIAKYQ